MYERLSSFVDQKNMFYSKQFGCGGKRSTIDNLAEHTKHIKLGSTDTFKCILLDLRKAFDSIIHDFLLAKLEKYGVRRICLKWFESFLKEQRQCVHVNDVLSEFL